MSKFVKVFAGLSIGVLALAVAVTPASAAALTSAQVSAIVSLLQSFGADAATISNVQSSLTGGTPSATPVATGTTFTQNLTLGSTGAEVTALQSFLESKGFLVIPAGVAKGYFGALTKSALAAFQAANGISPASGYFGPLTRASVNSMGGGSTGNTGSTGTGSTGTGITTSGVEGTLTVTLNPTPSSGRTVRENEKKQPVIGLKIEAKNSDLAVQRVKLNLGAQSTVYNKVFSRVYVMDGSTILAEMPMNSSTAFKEGSTYYIQITGFNFIVPKDQTKVLTIAMDLHNSIKASSATGCDGTGDSCTIQVDANGVRAIDGAGIDQNGPSAAISRSVTIGTLLTDAASAVLSLSTNSPEPYDIIAAGNTTEDEADEVELFRFNLKAEKDDLLLTDAQIGIAKVGSGAATATTAYLYDGSVLVGTASISATDMAGGNAVPTFSNIDYTIPKDTTKTFTVKVDIRDANATVANISGIATGTGLTVENSVGTGITVSGTASTTKTLRVRNVGPQITLVSKSISKSLTPSQNNYSTTTAKANFTVKVKAVGGDIVIGNAASGVPMVASSSVGYVGNSFAVHKNGAFFYTGGNSTSTNITVPSSGVNTASSSNSFVITEGTEVEVPFDFTFEARTADGAAFGVGSYEVSVNHINWWGTAGYASSTFMASSTAWRTDSISLP